MYKCYRISELGEVVGGGTPSTKNKNFWGGSIPWITPKDLAGYTSVYISKGENNITEAGLRSGSKLLPKDTVLITSRAPIGYIALANNPISTNQGFKSIICNQGICKPLYLYYYLKCNTPYLRLFGSGATFPEISGTVMKKIKLNIIEDVRVQDKLAHILKVYDDLIEKNNHKIEILQEMAEELYKEWFVRFRFPGYKTAKFTDGIPDGWEYGRISNLCNLKNGYAFPSSSFENIGSYGIIKIENVLFGDINIDKCSYLHGLFFNLIDDEKIARARLRMAQVLDNSVISNSDNSEQYQYKIHEGKIIDISKIDVEELKKEIKSSKYKAVEINDLREHIEKALEQMLAKNCTRRKFSERYKGIIDQYNAGGSENEDYYEKLAELIEDMKKETQRPILEGLSEEELEVYDLLIADKKLTKAEEQKVKLAAKNLYKKLTENKRKLFVVDWYKDDKPLAYVRSEVSKSLDSDLPESYDKDSFNVKVDLLVKHFMDMSVQGYGWVAH